MNYSELLKDPRWQRKRLEILNRDEFRCLKCEDSASTLHVHHRFYIQGKEPWDYPEWSLVTLCESCHTEETELLKLEKRLLIESFLRAGATSSDLNAITCALAEHFENGFDERFFSALAWVIEKRPWELIDVYFENLPKAKPIPQGVTEATTDHV